MENFILSDSVFNDTAATGCHILRSFFISSKERNNTKNLPLNILSESFKDTQMFLYDNPLLLSIYPNGLVTETFILLPVKKFQSIRENFAYIIEDKSLTKNKFKLINDSPSWAFALGFTLIKNLELKLNITLPKEETDIILKNILPNLNMLNSQSNSLNNIDNFKDYDLNLPSIKNKDLLKHLENENLLIVNVIKKMIQSYDENTISLKKWLSQYPELYNNLPHIKKSIKEFFPENSKTLTLNDLNENIIKYNNSECSIFKPLLQITNLIDNIKKQSNNDFDFLLANLKQDLFPYLLNTNDYLFNSSLNYLREAIFSSTHSNQENIEKFCNVYYDFCSPNNYQRDCLIKVMTYFNTLDTLAFEYNQEVLDKKMTKNNHLLSSTSSNRLKV